MKIKITAIVVAIIYVLLNNLTVYADDTTIRGGTDTRGFPIQTKIMTYSNPNGSYNYTVKYQQTKDNQVITAVTLLVAVPVLNFPGMYYISPYVLLYSDSPFKYSEHDTQINSGSLIPNQTATFYNGNIDVFKDKYLVISDMAHQMTTRTYNISGVYDYRAVGSAEVSNDDWTSAFSQLQGLAYSFFGSLVEKGSDWVVSNMTGVSKGDNASIVVDIETPKNVQVIHTSSMNRWHFRLEWEQPLTENGIKLFVELKSMSFLDYRLYPTQKYNNFSIWWHRLDDETLLAQEGRYDYRLNKDYFVRTRLLEEYKSKYNVKWKESNLDNYVFDCDVSFSLIPYKRLKKSKYPSFAIRYYYRDSDGIIHYSNWVEIKDSGNCEGYIANEVSEHDTKYEDKENVTIDNSNNNYNGKDNIMNDTGIGGSDNTSAIGTLKRLLNDLKDFPLLFSKLFLFLPVDIGSLISAFLVICIPLAILKFAFS